MTRVLIEATLSLDGYMAGPNVSADQPMGEEGLRLHEWVFNCDKSAADDRVQQEMFATTGAVVLGRRTFDVGIDVWKDTPFPVPCFVLTHRPAAERVEKSGTFSFVSDVRTAVDRARAAAGERDVRLMGGECSRACLDAGLVDEIRVQIAPVVLGAGRRLFDQSTNRPVDLERSSVISTQYVTHLRFNVKH